MKLFDTMSFVEMKFEGITDLAGVPYVNHLFAVYELVESDFKEDKLIALLHDVVEDTDVTLHILRGLGFSDYVVSGVDAITKRVGEAYSSYLKRVKQHEGARLVKIADIEHNSDLSRLKKIRSGDLKRLEKYKKATKFLKS